MSQVPLVFVCISVLDLVKRIDGQACSGGATLADLQGEITSPGYPNNYPDKAQCQWTIPTPSPSSQVTVGIVFQARM